MKGLKEAHSWLVCEIERERRKKHPPSTAAIAIAAFGRILHGGDVRVEEQPFREHLTSVGADASEVVRECFQRGWIVPVAGEQRRITIIETRLSEDAAEFASASQYVTLDSVAVFIGRNKDTLRRWMKDDSSAPSPAVEGGGGKAHEYRWVDLRPWLAEKVGRILPERFPDLTPDANGH
jgi:hypothetical protein